MKKGGEKANERWKKDGQGRDIKEGTTRMKCQGWNAKEGGKEGIEFERLD